jgi:hypothetical protein
MRAIAFGALGRLRIGLLVDCGRVVGTRLLVLP